MQIVSRCALALALVFSLAGAASAVPIDGGSKRLLDESSPYLRQHADNPVNWYPWGTEAIEKAKRENKPIYLSVGYSTCHWCHVMERESFMDKNIAAYLNEHFISVKVDRERRPDIDETFMLVTEFMAQRGGWPNNVFLTPELTPFMGETYLPPDVFQHMIKNIAERWAKESTKMLAEAKEMQRMVDTVMNARLGSADLTTDLMKQVTDHLSASFDLNKGGTQGTPKFPNESLLLFMLHQAERHGHVQAAAAADATLDAIVRGGIHDQLGGGFHRYALDENWNVPHFEKMLYNQALIARALINSYGRTGNPGHAHAARNAFDFVLSDMTAPGGAFVSAFDADSKAASGEKKEGAYYTWPHAELQEHLTADEVRLLEIAFGVRFEGNFESENVLFSSGDHHAKLKALKLTPEEFGASVASISKKLKSLRAKRTPPHRDDKILTGWNALMIRAFAEGGRVLGEEKYVETAKKAAEFIWANMRNEKGHLMRFKFEGRAELIATQADYAYFGSGLIALYDAGAGDVWLERAEQVAADMDTLFLDEKSGDYFFTTDDVEFIRPKIKTDVTLPAGNASALELFARLSRRSLKPIYRTRADMLIANLSGLVVQLPNSTPYSLLAADLAKHGESGPLQYAGRGKVRAEVQRTGAKTLSVTLNIAQGWHVNAHEVANADFIPTSVAVGTRTSSMPSTVNYPDYKKVKLGFSDDVLSLFEGKVKIEVQLTERSENADVVQLEAQACSDEICLLPELLTLNIPPMPAEG